MGNSFWKHVTTQEYAVIAVMVVIFLIPVVAIFFCKFCSSVMGVCYEFKTQRRRRHRQPPKEEERRKSITSVGNQTDSGFSEKIQLIDETQSTGRMSAELSPRDSAIGAVTTLVAASRHRRGRSDGGIQSYSQSDLSSLAGSRDADFDTTPGDSSPPCPLSPPPETTTDPFAYSHDHIVTEHQSSSPPLTPPTSAHASNRPPESSMTYSEMLDEEFNSSEVLPARNPIHWELLAIDHPGVDQTVSSDQGATSTGELRDLHPTSQDSNEEFPVIVSSSLSDNTRYEE